MSEKYRRTSECLGNISDVSKRNSNIGVKTSEILFVHSKKNEATSASLHNTEQKPPFKLSLFPREIPLMSRQGVKVVKAKNAKLQGMRARVTREGIGEAPKMPWFTRAIPLDFYPWVFLAKNMGRHSKNQRRFNDINSDLTHRDTKPHYLCTIKTSQSSQSSHRITPTPWTLLHLLLLLQWIAPPKS